MSGLISLLIVQPFVLMNLPMVRSKGFASCMKVTVLNVIILTVLFIFSSPVLALTAMIGGAIPFIGPELILPVTMFILTTILSTASLYIADQIIEDFEIKTLPETVMVAVILSVVSNVVNAIL